MRYKTTDIRSLGQQEVNSVLARELCANLEVKKDFSDWIKAKIKQCMLDENTDFMVVWSDPKKGDAFLSKAEVLKETGTMQKASALGWRSDYILSIRAAKEISMVTGGKKGKASRTYFLNLEEQLLESKSNTPALPQTFAEALMLAAQLEMEKEQALLEVKEKEKVIERKNDIILDVADLNIKSGDVLIGDFAKNLNIKGLGPNKMSKWLKNRGFLTMHRKPYQQYVDRGYFVMKPSIKRINGRYRYTTYLTPKGTVWLAGIIKAEYRLED